MEALTSTSPYSFSDRQVRMKVSCPLENARGIVAVHAV
jgi:hypothetical protein